MTTAEQVCLWLGMALLFAPLVMLFVSLWLAAHRLEQLAKKFTDDESTESHQ